MASAKRKQDERNLKALRELVSLPGNKECFDCRQRGPTYVNMTIGSFVCTTCSGLLRGLTPPHRVKSISMATFTQEEVDFIKERGNERCRRIWLGLTNPNGSQTVDSKDEQKMKDLMSAKYELKRYYLDPSVANQNSTHTSVPRVPQSAGASTTLAAPPSQKSREPKALVNANDFMPDFPTDFSKFPARNDRFVASTPVNRISQQQQQQQQPILPQPSFANFDNNPVFNNSPKSNTAVPANATGASSFAMNMNGSAVPPSEDRYAALKDLDSLMKQTQLKEEPVSSLPTTSPWNANNSNATNSIWGTTTNQTTHVISNPFVSGDLWRPSANVVNNNTQPIDGPLCNPANPFKPMQFPVNNVSDSQWMGLAGSTNGDVIPFSQLMTPLSNKMWQPAVPAYHANPFMVGSGVSNMTRNSNNPFL